MTTDKINTPSERLKIICETYYGGNKSKMAKELNVSYQNINNYIEKGKKPSFEVIQSIYEVFKNRISTEWLILGTGDMFVSGIINPHAPTSSSTTHNGTGASSTSSNKIVDYQSLIIELQQKVIRQLEK
ncbi:MAG: helix-turn-helix transcriptional regulator [Bacteroidia bacterium]|nr:helix-turn-helix transcriptional regulator [Bacteroidia bacterium]